MILFRCPSGRALSNNLIQKLHQKVCCLQIPYGWCVGTCFKNIALGVASAMLPMLGRPGLGSLVHPQSHLLMLGGSLLSSPLCLQQGQPPKQVSGASSVSLSHSLLTDRLVCGEPLPSMQDFHTRELIFLFFLYCISAIFC